jgi:DNA primase
MAEILRYNIGYCVEGVYAKRIIIPSYDDMGILNYFVGRDYSSRSSIAYINPKVSKNVVAFDNQINWKYPLFIVEGMFDAMAVKRNAIPQLGKTLSRKLQQKIIQQSATDIYLALDNDAIRFALKAAERLMKENINVYMVPMDGKDPSAIGFDDMQTRIKSAEKITFASLVHLKLQLS